MEKKISDQIIELTTKLMLVRDRADAIRLSSEFNSVIQQIMELEQSGDVPIHSKSATTILKFTKKEISNMAETFKKVFIANGLAAHVIKRTVGKSNYYEIRYRANGYNISACSKTLAEAKRLFLEKTTPKEILKYVVKVKAMKDCFASIFEEFYKYKKGLVAEKTLLSYRTTFYKCPQELQQKHITEVRTGDIDEYLKTLTPRGYEDARIVFNSVFKYAIASGIMTNNPVALIPFKRAERESRDCLSREELSTLLERIKAPKYDRIRQGILLSLFFGLRPCEIEDDEKPRREGDFLIARNRKRKGGKVEYKKIPISKEADELIDWDKPLEFMISPKPRERLTKTLMDGNTAYNLRHTFCSLCRETVREDIVDVWMGDSSERLIGRVYTHFSDEFMLEQMSKVKFTQ